MNRFMTSAINSGDGETITAETLKFINLRQIKNSRQAPSRTEFAKKLNTAKTKNWSQRLIFSLATKCGWLAILALGFLTRIRFFGREYFEWLRDNQKPFIYCIWHGRILLPIFVHRYENIQAMVSLHDDGEMIAQTLHRLGYETARGSSTRGGPRAMIEMIRYLKNGGIAAIMPDGPKGPRHEFKTGPVVIAQRSGAYLLPFTFSSTRLFQFKSWDRFTIMLPFSTSVAMYGEPVSVPADAGPGEVERIRQDLEKRMVELEQRADAYFQ